METKTENIILKNETLNLAKIVSKDETRVGIMGIYIDREKQRAVATNGNALAYRPLADNEQVNGHNLYAFKGKTGKIGLNVFSKLSDIDVYASTEQATLNPIEATFPDYERIIPAEDKAPVFTIGLDVKLLSKLVEAMSLKGKEQIVKLEFYGEREICRVTAKESATTGLIMPCKTE